MDFNAFISCFKPYSLAQLLSGGNKSLYHKNTNLLSSLKSLPFEELKLLCGACSGRVIRRL